MTFGIRSRSRVSRSSTARSGKQYFADNRILRVKVFNRDLRLVYSDDRTAIGTWALPRAGTSTTALRGKTVRNLEAGVLDDGTGARTLEVYVPVRLAAGGEPAGVLELYMSYGPVAQEIRDDVLVVYLLLGGGLVILFAALFRIVAAASRRLRHQALHDALTGLPNRSLLHLRAERALRGDHPAAILLIDLDRFKEVNDTLGHEHGDELLVEVAERLRGALRQGDTLARFGGDEFAVLLDGLPHRGAVAELAGRLQDALRSPFALRGVAVALEASIGAALYPDHGMTVSTLLQRADVAMYDAKRGRRGVSIYSTERDPYSADRLGLLAELRRAISSDELVLHFQPKVALDTGDVVGVEALVRWQHPTRGLLPPDEFVPLAARTGAVADLTRWVLDSALAQQSSWSAQGIDLPVAVNLAAANIVDVTLPGRDRSAARTPRRGRGSVGVRDLRAHGHVRSRTRHRRARAPARRLACGCRSTTSAPVIRRWPTSSGFRSTRSRSTARSSPAWPRTRTTR